MRKGSEASGGRHGQPRPVGPDVAGLLCGWRGRRFGKEVLWIAQSNTGAPQVWVEAETATKYVAAGRVHRPMSTCMDPNPARLLPCADAQDGRDDGARARGRGVRGGDIEPDGCG